MATEPGTVIEMKPVLPLLFFINLYNNRRAEKRQGGTVPERAIFSACSHPRKRATSYESNAE